jgi:Holliday junction resolvase RusA-like endonuclease
VRLPVPPSANRWWRNVNGRMVTSAAARDYKQAIPALAGKQPKILAPTPVMVSVIWYRAMKSGDLDKRLGVVLDALQGVSYESDSQIVELHAYRLEDENREGWIEVDVRAAE